MGLEQAGFEHVALVELDKHCCTTLRFNRPKWNVIQADLNNFDGRPYRGVDFLAGGVPCPPFSVAGKQPSGKQTKGTFSRRLYALSPKFAHKQSSWKM